MRQQIQLLVGVLMALCISGQALALTATASPTNCASVGGIGSVAWTNPARAVSSNNSYATASVDGTTTRYLQCTGYNFAIPAGAIINGITVNVERRSNSALNGGIRDAAMRIVKGGVIGATDRSTATTYTTADVIQAHGGAADLWGLAWTSTDINAATFGAAFAATKPNAAGAAQTVSVDHVQIIVDYTPLSGTFSVTASPTNCSSVAGIGTVAWTNPTRAQLSDNSYATASVDGTTTRYLRCIGYNFAIPAGAVINGITVNVERRSNSIANGGIRDAAMRVIKAGVIGTTDRSTALTYTTADVVQAHGGAVDLWGTTWTSTDINAATFGAAFAATKANAAGAAQTVSVDHVPITVTYTISALDHIRIIHDGNGLTCTPSVLTVIACANAACTAPNYTATAVTGNVTWAGVPGGSVPFNITVGGTTTVNLPVTTVQTGTLGTGAVAPAALNISDCVNTAGGAACSLPFADSGLLLNVPNHVSETSQNISISAVRKANNAPNCVPAFSGVSRALNLRCAYLNPATGTLPVRIGGTALNAAANAGAACDGVGRNITLAFNAAGTANPTLQYADVGQMQLNASYTGTVANGDAGLLLSGSGSFIAAPASFAFGGVTAGLLKAGSSFSATVTARNTASAATPNFGKESAPQGVTLVANLVAPVGGVNPALTNNIISGGTFTNGAATANNLSWGEVGLITLTANLSSANYLGSSLSATGTSGNVGRFIPEHFNTIISGGMPCPIGLACPILYNGFVYSGQPFNIQVNALNLADAATQNYDGVLGYSKNVTLSAWNAAGSATANPGPGTLSNNTIAATDFISGTALINAGNIAPATLAPIYALTNPTTIPTEVYIRAIDTDNATSLRGVASVEGGIEVVNGRIRVSNAYGSELLPLTMTVNAQYWNGANWALSTTDSATSFNTKLNTAGGNVVPTIVQGPLAMGNINVVSGGAVTVANGSSVFTLVKPNVTGMADIAINAPAYFSSVPGRATFGVYQGSTPFIYQRESY
jgi:MSHA biogenesis protein MshQ